MDLAIIGLPLSGVTTVFNALTGRHEDTHAYAKPGELNVAVVKVPDPRLDFLAELYEPKKVVHASIEYIEVPGLFSAGSGGASAEAGAVATVRDCDATVKVLRAFDADDAPNPRGENDPVRDLRDINDELLMLDLSVIEKRVKRLRKDVRKPTPEQDQNKVELAALERCLAGLEEGQELRDIHLTEPEEKLLRGYGFLTIQPSIHVVNMNESDVGRGVLPADLPADNSLAFCAELEEELSELPPADRKEFLDDLGIDELARDRFIRMSYDLLGLISFFTHNESEVRAWTLKKGSTALDAAGTIHSDLARGFIRAEVINADDLRQDGSEREARAHGHTKSEGRDYVVQDGDVITVRFNV